MFYVVIRLWLVIVFGIYLFCCHIQNNKVLFLCLLSALSILPGSARSISSQVCELGIHSRLVSRNVLQSRVVLVERNVVDKVLFHHFHLLIWLIYETLDRGERLLVHCNCVDFSSFNANLLWLDPLLLSNVAWV